MINIVLPDDSVRNYDSHVTGMQIAESISKSLLNNAYLIEVDGILQDLSKLIRQDAKVRILTDKDSKSLETLRHDTAHLLAEAVKELHPETQVTIGPAIENGFYYDFARKEPFNMGDLEAIEKKMQEIALRNEAIIREEWQRDDAIKFFKSIGENYKAEIIESIPEGEVVSLYRQGNFVDLCRGPHGPSTNKLKHFKLMKVAGAYWRGDSNNVMLQRIYGTVFATEKELKDYLFMLEEAEKRDHRKIGKELDLFHFQDEAKGVPFWHDKGWKLYKIIRDYISEKLIKNDYQEVNTPIVLSRSLWEASGHFEQFGNDMFHFSQEEENYAIKPMNCPCHIQIFKQGIKSYKDLPLRMAEFGTCHRNEASGALHGLMRVRGFTQDDAHIFCTEDQITSETIKFCKLLTEVYSDFGFEDIKVKFSDRPEKRSGSDEVWDKAENALKEAVTAAGFEYTLNPGEGAFYGPKLEFVLRDAIGRDWQCGTLQVDLVLPSRLGATYIAAEGDRKIPVMLHRAILGSFERFIGILIEQYSGKFPLWLAPVQVAVLSITNDAENYAKLIQEKLVASNIRSVIDISSEKISYKIRNFSLQKVPLLVIVGKNEADSNMISLRKLGSTEHGTMKLEMLIDEIKNSTIIKKKLI